MNPLAPKHLVAACQRVVRTLDGTASSVVWTTIGNGPLPAGTPGVSELSPLPLKLPITRMSFTLSLTTIRFL